MGAGSEEDSNPVYFNLVECWLVCAMGKASDIGIDFEE